MGERRSVALEKTYVHEVYQQMTKAEHPFHDNTNPWPRIKQLMEDLEPGSLVCDVGCGNGKYLSMNSSVFKIGGERCSRLAEVAREKENEIIICDNLSLPFRDESFDAVLSIAVVHHLATTERRVCALKELARVLRIGGKLIITVWAMEQKNRKFESQDVLVPWHRPQAAGVRTPSMDSWQSTTGSEDNYPPPYHAYLQTSDSDSTAWSQRAQGQTKSGKNRHKGRSIDPMRTSSPSSSSLSSPNETCYSFVRRALQKLAGGKRGGSRSRSWFLEPWSSSSQTDENDKIPLKRYDPEGCEDTEDIQDIPIELRRLEEDTDSASQKRQNYASTRQTSDQLNYKSKSLSDIPKVEEKQNITRSRSSVPSLNLDLGNIKLPDKAQTSSLSTKAKLVKQKKSICDEDLEEEDRDKPTDMRDLVKALPEFKVSNSNFRTRGNVFNKQISMNEELMSTDRLQEKERVRQNIQKQASLNEELIYRRPRAIDSLRNSFFSTSTSTAKRFQLLKSGLTNKLKSSTTGIEKVTGSTFKNGFVRMLQGWKGDIGAPIPQPAPFPPPPMVEIIKSSIDDKTLSPNNSVERRHSKEDGSDSSKDSSLQSDTSVDSEDSFASVIFVGAKSSDPSVDQSVAVTSPTLLTSNPASPQSTSPKLKFPPTAQPISPKLGPSKSPQSSFGLYSHPSSPKIKQIPALHSTSTPSSPMLKHFPQPLSPRPFYTILSSAKQSSLLKPQNSVQSSPSDSPIQKLFPQVLPPSGAKQQPKSPVNNTSPTTQSMSSVLTCDDPNEFPPEPVMRLSPTPASKKFLSPKEEPQEGFIQEKLSPGISPTSPEAAREPSKPEKKPEEEPKKSLIKSVTSINITKSSFPLVRRSTTDSSNGSDISSVTCQPNLLSLELFNPETDDVDSDSSGLSSSDSVGSVISVLNEELATDFSSIDMKAEKSSSDGTPKKSHGSTSSLPTSMSAVLNLDNQSKNLESKDEHPTQKNPSNSLIDAAADVASCLEEAVDTVLKSSPRSRRRHMKLLDSTADSINSVLDNIFNKKLENVVKEKDMNDKESEIMGNAAGTYDHKIDSSKTGYEQQFTRKLQDLKKAVDQSEESKLADSDSWQVRLESYTREERQNRNLGAMPKTKMSIKDQLDGIPSNKISDPSTVDEDDGVTEKEEDPNCRMKLVEFAEKLSEKLLAEIDKYHEKEEEKLNPLEIKNSEDPYLQRLSRELKHLNELSLEIQNKQSELRKANILGNKDGNSIQQTSIPSGFTTIEKKSKDSKTNSKKISSTSQFEEQETFEVVKGIEVPLVTSEKESKSKTRKKLTKSVSKIDEPAVDEKLDYSSEESSDAGIWADSRRNTITSKTETLKNMGVKESTSAAGDIVTSTTSSLEIGPHPSKNSFVKTPEHKIIQLLSGNEILRRPSISVETSEPFGRIVTGKSEEMISEASGVNGLHAGLSVESSEAGDISDRTGGSSSEGSGSRSDSRRGTIQVETINGSTSFKARLSLESNDNGDITGSVSDVSRAGDSRRNTICGVDDPPTGSQISLLRPGTSIESSDYGDISDRTASGSETKGSIGGIKTASTASLASDRWSDCSKDIKFADRKIARCDGRSSSEETVPRKAALIRQRASVQDPTEILDKAESPEASLTDSTSQDSILSDCAGGSITFHRYYHLFKKGELEQLIKMYIGNLHIISSYYDHANWCVIAEKVQVWTI